MMDDTERADSLNVRLAKWAGWRVERRTSNALPYLGESYWLLRPSGEVERATFTEAEAWQHAPDYAGSLDAGMALVPKHMAVDFRATRNGIPMGFYRVSLIDWTVRGRQSWWWDAEGATRAEALAAALEAMLMAQQEAGGDARQS